VVKVIVSFDDKNSEELFETGRNRRFAAIARPALRKLIILDTAEGSSIFDLADRTE
jgi:plasmid maintenance system killer protein